MNWRSPRLGLAFLLSFSGCSCEWHAGTNSSYSTSGGEQVIVVQDPDRDARERAARQQREQEWARDRERARHPRVGGDPNKSITVRGNGPSAAPTSGPIGTGGPAPAPPPASFPSASAPASAPSIPVAVPAQPTPSPAPVAQPTPAPAAPAAPAESAPPPSAAPAAPGDTFVRARTPGQRPTNTGGAVTPGDRAKDEKKAPARPVAPSRSR